MDPLLVTYGACILYSEKSPEKNAVKEVAAAPEYPLLRVVVFHFTMPQTV